MKGRERVERAGSRGDEGRACMHTHKPHASTARQYPLPLPLLRTLSLSRRLQSPLTSSLLMSGRLTMWMLGTKACMPNMLTIRPPLLKPVTVTEKATGSCSRQTQSEGRAGRRGQRVRGARHAHACGRWARGREGGSARPCPGAPRRLVSLPPYSPVHSLVCCCCPVLTSRLSWWICDTLAHSMSLSYL